MKKLSLNWNFFRSEFLPQIKTRLISIFKGVDPVKTDDYQDKSQSKTFLDNDGSADDEQNKSDQEIELLDIEPRRRINPEDRKKLQRVLEVINQHLPDRMLTTNPLKNEIDLRIRDNQTQSVRQKNKIHEKVV